MLGVLIFSRNTLGGVTVWNLSSNVAMIQETVPLKQLLYSVGTGIINKHGKQSILYEYNFWLKYES